MALLLGKGVGGVCDKVMVEVGECKFLYKKVVAEMEGFVVES